MCETHGSTLGLFFPAVADVWEPLLEDGLDRPKNRYGRYGFPSFYNISISTVGMDEARVFL